MAKQKKDKTNYAEMSSEDLSRRVAELVTELGSAHQKLRMGQFKKISDFTRIRREIARCKTILRARELKAKKAA